MCVLASFLCEENIIVTLLLIVARQFDAANVCEKFARNQSYSHQIGVIQCVIHKVIVCVFIIIMILQEIMCIFTLFVHNCDRTGGSPYTRGYIMKLMNI